MGKTYAGTMNSLAEAQPGRREGTASRKKPSLSACRPAGSGLSLTSLQSSKPSSPTRHRLRVKGPQRPATSFPAQRPPPPESRAGACPAPGVTGKAPYANPRIARPDRRACAELAGSRSRGAPVLSERRGSVTSGGASGVRSDTGASGAGGGFPARFARRARRAKETYAGRVSCVLGAGKEEGSRAEGPRSAVSGPGAFARSEAPYRSRSVVSSAPGPPGAPLGERL